MKNLDWLNRFKNCSRKLWEDLLDEASEPLRHKLPSQLTHFIISGMTNRNSAFSKIDGVVKSDIPF
jgi:hypothetical protein